MDDNSVVPIRIIDLELWEASPWTAVNALCKYIIVNCTVTCTFYKSYWTASSV